MCVFSSASQSTSHPSTSVVVSDIHSCSQTQISAVYLKKKEIKINVLHKRIDGKCTPFLFS